MFADVIVEDREDRPFMLVEVKASVAASEVVQEFIHRLDRSDSSILFGMLVDLEDIHVLMRDSSQSGFAPLVNLKTTNVLRHYDPEFAGKEQRYGSVQIFREYVEVLVEGWLRDLAYHWKTSTPVGSEELSGTGLLEKIQGGMTRRSEVVADGGILR